MNRIKKTKNIGSLSGKVLVFGGVYSNLQALQEIRRISKSLSIPASNVICTGDIVAYCAQPEACVQEIINWDIHCIAGNVEIQLSEGSDDCGCNFTEGSRCNIFSNQWYPYTQRKLSQKSIDWMSTLPDFLDFEYANKKGHVVHGSYYNTSEFIFKSTDWSVFENNFQDTSSEIILAGHCGLPFHKAKPSKTWINAGVIGMPANDGTSKVWYAILDDSNGFSFQHFSFVYDHFLAASLMKSEGLPDTYAKTLGSGIWDNCEILPDLETEEQGEVIRFE